MPKRKETRVKEKPRILLYGNSIIIGTIGASLRRCSHYDVIAIAQEAQEIDASKLDMVLFDLEGPCTESVFSLLKTNPNLVLIGVSPDTNMVKLWSGRQLRELSTQDLIEVINGELNNLPAEGESPDLAVVDLSTGNEDILALLAAFRSSSIPTPVHPKHEDPVRPKKHKRQPRGRKHV
jgi:hypothetical protein